MFLAEEPAAGIFPRATARGLIEATQLTRYTLENLMIGVLAPIAPMIFWGIREFQQHGEAADTSDRLREKSMALWADALSKRMEDELKIASRQLQGEIFGRRASAPMIFDWIYGLLRKSGEEEMNVATEQLVAEAKKTGF